VIPGDPAVILCAPQRHGSRHGRKQHRRIQPSASPDRCRCRHGRGSGSGTRRCGHGHATVRYGSRPHYRGAGAPCWSNCGNASGVPRAWFDPRRTSRSGRHRSTEQQERRFHQRRYPRARSRKHARSHSGALFLDGPRQSPRIQCRIAEAKKTRCGKPAGFRLSGIWGRPRMRVLSSLFPGWRIASATPPRAALQGGPSAFLSGAAYITGASPSAPGLLVGACWWVKPLRMSHRPSAGRINFHIPREAGWCGRWVRSVPLWFHPPTVTAPLGSAGTSRGLANAASRADLWKNTTS
jgi:hypothetical protein